MGFYAVPLSSGPPGPPIAAATVGGSSQISEGTGKVWKGPGTQRALRYELGHCLSSR